MHRRNFLQTLAAAPLLSAADTKDWNVLVITSDEHNAKILGCAGNPVIKTPNLDRLAKEGVLFGNAYCADPICAPTRQSLMTGNYPQEHGQFGNAFIFSAKNRTWGEHFHDHGFTTACIGKTHTNNEDAKFGFDYRNPVGEKKASQRKSDPVDAKAYEASPDTRFSGNILLEPQRDHDALVATDSIRWLKENKGKRFFLHASFVKPHWPWDAPEEFYHMYDPAKIDLPKQVPGDLDDDVAPRKIYENWSWRKLTEQQHRIFRARYYGSLSWMDSHVGKLLQTLDDLDLSKKTLVVYTTDHGDMAGEKGCWLKSVMFEGSARIPLIMRMPAVIRAGSKTRELINHVDLFPTLATLAGAGSGLPSNLSGRDLSQMVLGKAKGREMSFSVHGVRSSIEPPQQVMARSGKWKFVWYPNAPEAQQNVLYDMKRDSDEITNVAGKPENSKVVADNRKAIQAFLEGLKRPPETPKQLRGERRHVPE